MEKMLLSKVNKGKQFTTNRLFNVVYELFAFRPFKRACPKIITFDISLKAIFSVNDFVVFLYLDMYDILFSFCVCVA